MNRLANKVAIVTGAGRGIGREYALALAREGAKVVVNDLGGELQGGGKDAAPADAVVREIEALGGEAIANHADVADHAAAGRSVRRSACTRPWICSCPHWWGRNTRAAHWRSPEPTGASRSPTRICWIAWRAGSSPST